MQVRVIAEKRLVETTQEDQLRPCVASKLSRQNLTEEIVPLAPRQFGNARAVTRPSWIF